MVVGIRQTRSAINSSGSTLTPTKAPIAGSVAQTIRNVRVIAASSMVSAISFGVFWRLAPSTREIMRSRKLCPGSAVTRTTISSDSTLVPPITPLRSVPASRRTGADSPVTADSLMVARPCRISPSAGISSPADTTTRSPGRRSAAATCASEPRIAGEKPLASVSRRATRSLRARRSDAAWPRPRASATASAKLPNNTVTSRIAVTLQPKPAGAAPAAVISADSRVPPSTTAITGLLTMCRGASLRKASRIAVRSAAASNTVGCWPRGLASMVCWIMAWFLHAPG